VGREPDREAAAAGLAHAQAIEQRPGVIAPRMPVAITGTAVSEGRPPRRSATAMAIGVVTDFGAKEAMVARLAPSSQAMATALATAVAAPTKSARAMGTKAARTESRCRQSGTARATVAGPKRKWTIWAPSK
jgi:hypothetical protein